VFLVALVFSSRGSDRSTTLGLLAGVGCGAVSFFQTAIFGLSRKAVEWPWAMLAATLVTVAVSCAAPRRPRG
jgi:Na+/proline symporter